ncbi:MAG: FkbM family methyltransferase [Waterburya sp.]
MNKTVKTKYLTIKEEYETKRRKLFEAMGLERYSRPALNNLDRKLEKYLNYQQGFFIEVGGNDGYKQSNTYYYERFRDWTGILVEGIPTLYEKCVLERPKSRVFNCALVENGFPESHVTMRYANLMSLVQGAQKNEHAEESHVNKWLEREQKKQTNSKSYEVQVPARTLTSILDECLVDEIDFFSLDVEGYELNVLQGLDFNKYRPKYMLIEARYKAEIEAYISEFYVKIDQFSHHDFLYKCK